MGSEADEMGAQSHIEAGYRGDVQRLEREIAEAQEDAKKWRWLQERWPQYDQLEVDKIIDDSHIRDNALDEAQAALAQAQEQLRRARYEAGLRCPPEEKLFHVVRVLNEGTSSPKAKAPSWEGEMQR